VRFAVVGEPAFSCALPTASCPLARPSAAEQYNDNSRVAATRDSVALQSRIDLVGAPMCLIRTSIVCAVA